MKSYFVNKVLKDSDSVWRPFFLMEAFFSYTILSIDLVAAKHLGVMCELPSLATFCGI